MRLFAQAKSKAAEFEIEAFEHSISFVEQVDIRTKGS